MKEHFHRLFLYEKWANNRIIDFLNNTPAATTRSLGLLTHIMAAQGIWLSRFTSFEFQGGLFDVKSLGELISQNETNLAAINQFFLNSTEGTFAEVITYKNIKGESFQTSLSDILVHLVNHGSHHRAQILSDMKANGAVVPAIDYILFARQ